jgi:hypothetical protein
VNQYCGTFCTFLIAVVSNEPEISRLIVCRKLAITWASSSGIKKRAKLIFMIGIWISAEHRLASGQIGMARRTGKLLLGQCSCGKGFLLQGSVLPEQLVRILARIQGMKARFSGTLKYVT